MCIGILRRTNLILLSCCIFFYFGCSNLGIPKSPEGLGQEKVKLELRKSERWVTKQGIVVHYLYDDELPHVSGKLRFKGGSLYEDQNLVGLASLTGSLIREGGTRELTPEQLDAKLSSLAASIESGFGAEFGRVGFYSLSEDFEEVFGLFSDVVRKPRFDAKRFALLKRLALAGITRRRDDPNGMANITMRHLFYGEESPYASLSSFESLKRIKISDLRKFYKQYVRPQQAHLTVSGKITREELEKAIEKSFGDWTAPKVKLQPLPPVELKLNPGIYVLERDFDQATILLGHSGPQRLTEDMYAITLYNRVFGHGGLGSLLFSELRSKLGLAYTVYGGFSSGSNRGRFSVYIGTKVSQAVNAIRKVLWFIEQSREKLPDNQRFVDAKNAIDRNYVFNFTTTSAIVAREASLEMLGFPKDFDKKYLDNIALVTRSDILEVAKSRVNPGKLAIIVVGRVSAEELAREFKDIYPVYRLDFDTKPKVLGKVVG